MKLPSWRKLAAGAGIQRDLGEIRDLVVRYVKEETVQPLKDLGRFVAFGALGSVFVGLGTVLLLVGALRYLQWQFPVLDGTLSWIPYLVVAVLAILVIALALWRVVSGAAKRRARART